MTDSCDQDHERNSDASSSDSDSISLLLNPNDCQSRGSAEDMEISDSASQDGNKEQKSKVEMKPLHPVTEAGSTSCCTQSAVGCADSASQSANAKEPIKIQLHKRNGKGETLLHRACKREDVARVKALIQAGISVNMEDYAGWTALHEACALGHEAVVEELLKAGANVNARSFDGVTPLHDAASSGHYQVTFRDNPLSYYLLNMESDGNRPQTCPEEDVQHCSASTTQEALTTVSASLNHIIKIKRIHLVDDDELLPNTIMDSYWEKLLQKDCSESEDWGSELL
ncbi:hypothetical protein PAMP_022835 [Pampus punctatissimus]